MTKRCEFCEAEYDARGPQRYCSAACQRERERQRYRGRTMQRCEECGVEFRGKLRRETRRVVCRSCVFSGARNPRYRGGRVYDAASRRWRVCCRDGTFLWYARALMEAHLGRPLRRDEHVHHINGDRTDDRLENLTILDPVTHGHIHGYQSGEVRRARKAAA